MVGRSSRQPATEGTSTPSPMRLQLVSTSSCSAYDCEFVAAAQQLDVPLITEDRAILVAFPVVTQSLQQATSGGQR